jgi:hypothetical protein
VRNLALHLSAPTDAVNTGARRLIVSGLRSIGIDANDPDSTVRSGFYLSGLSSHEMNAGNPLHLLLIAVAAPLVLRRGQVLTAARRYYLDLVAAFIVFCAMLRWEPWNSRYHLPLFMLGVAVASAVITRLWRRMATVAGAGLLFSVGPFVFMNSLRPIVPTPWKPGSILIESR